MVASMFRVDDGWLVVAPPENPEIRLDARVFDRVLANDDRLVMAIDDYVVSLLITTGSAAATELASQLVPHLHQPRSGPCLFVGQEAVRSSPPYVVIGACAFRIHEVSEYAGRGAQVPLDNGHIQAAILLIAVRASELGLVPPAHS